MSESQIGTCEVCNRPGVKVHPGPAGSPWAKRRQMICTDTAACFEAWKVIDGPNTIGPPDEPFDCQKTSDCICPPHVERIDCYAPDRTTEGNGT